MFPSVDTQHRNQVRATGALGPLLFLFTRAMYHVPLVGPVLVVKPFADLVATLVGYAADGVHVQALTAPVGAGVGATGEVGGQDAVLADIFLVDKIFLPDEPYETRAEHGVGGKNHLPLQVIDAAKGQLEMLPEFSGHDKLVRVLSSVGRDAGEEEFVVVGHGSEVEDGGQAGLAGGLDCELFGIRAF